MKYLHNAQTLIRWTGGCWWDVVKLIFLQTLKLVQHIYIYIYIVAILLFFFMINTNFISSATPVAFTTDSPTHHLLDWIYHYLLTSRMGKIISFLGEIPFCQSSTSNFQICIVKYKTVIQFILLYFKLIISLAVFCYL